MEKLQKFYIYDHESIKAAASRIIGGLVRCIIVLNKNDKVVGVFSEGDILRAILEDVELHAPLSRVMKPSFLYLKKKDMEEAYGLVKKFGVSMIPVVDDNFHLKDVISFFDVLEFLSANRESKR